MDTRRLIQEVIQTQRELSREELVAILLDNQVPDSTMRMVIGITARHEARRHGLKARACLVVVLVSQGKRIEDQTVVLAYHYANGIMWVTGRITRQIKETRE